MITDLGDLFTGNDRIETFEEFKYFTGITELDATCFNNCTSLTKIHIPDSVTVLEPDAFSNCTALTHLVIGNGITELTGDYFKESTQLEYLEIGTGMERIGYNAFYNKYTKLETLVFHDGENPLVILSSFNGCSSLKSVILPKNTVEVTSGAFSNCSELEYLEIQSSMESGAIQSGAFYDCNKLKTLIIGNGITFIGSGCFSGLPLLSSVTILGGENKNVELGYTFSNLPALTKLTIPNTIEKINSGAFSNLENLTELVFENGDSNIVMDSTVFYPLTNLERLVIGSSVKSIAQYRFYDLPNLTELVLENGDSPIEIFPGNFSRLPKIETIHLSNRIHEIGLETFYGNTILNSFTVDATNPAFSAEDGVLYNKDKTKIIKYPQGKPFDNYIITEHILEISDDAFDNVIINSFVVDAANPAFSVEDGVLYNKDKTKIIAYPNNKSDVEFTIPNTVVDITPGIFISNNLLKLTIPDSVTSLPKECFYNCSSLTEIIIPDSVTSIGDYCFRSCSSLQAISVLNLIPPTIGYNIFAYIHEDFYVYVPYESVDLYKVADGWVDYADKISPIISDLDIINISDPEVRRILTTDFGFPIHGEGFHREDIQSITDLGESFINNGLIETFEEFQYFTGVTEIETGAFNGCTSLTSITLPESVTSLGAYCFNYCSSLTSINIPEGITSLLSSSFRDCTALASINIPAGVTSIGESCFYNCESLTIATVLPAIPPSLGTSAFDGVHSSFNIYVPDESVDAYKTASGWDAYADKIFPLSTKA
jgi:hypothetical protein